MRSCALAPVMSWARAAAAATTTSMAGSQGRDVAEVPQLQQLAHQVHHRGTRNGVIACQRQVLQAGRGLGQE